jgi:glycosyltransferase involved in cell wall biosynthesis
MSRARRPWYGLKPQAILTAMSPESSLEATGEGGAASRLPVVLHVPFTYFPDASGGTEVYVHGLATRLGAFGYRAFVAAPGATGASYEHDGVPVRRFTTDRRPRLELAYGEPDDIAAAAFTRVLDEIRPDVVHLHARTSAISEKLVDAARAAGARVVFTYHTPTVSCARGTMMEFGETPCDGRVEKYRCVACALAANGAPEGFARLAASLPETALATLSRMERLPWRLSALRVPGLIAAQRERLLRFMSKLDHVVAVCDWVRGVLLANGVPSERITLSRQGVDGGSTGETPPRAWRRDGPLRIAFFGRIDRAKGPDLLGEALKLAADAKVEVDIFAIRQSGSDRDWSRLEDFARGDSRLTVRAAVASGEVRATMAGYDLIAIPSRGLETGPLVALDAFQAGVPILGAKLGGIAELVRDDVDGVLVKPDDARAWADAVARLASNPSVVEDMRANIRPPRTMAEAANDMAGLYAALGVPPMASVAAARS